MTIKPKSSARSRRADKVLNALRRWRQFMPVGLALGVPQILRAENHVDYRYEFYNEEHDRMQIQTHSVYFEQKLMDAVVVKGELVYDGISGATPRGVTDPNVTDHLRDTRWAGNLALDWQFGSHLLTPGFAYSKENDYESYTISLNDGISFNDKNTTLQFGVSHNFDSVRFTDGKNWLGKDTTDGMIGISQLLTPNTVLSANLSVGYEDGYLSDPYRLAQFTTFGFAFNEKRPGYKTKEVGLISLTQYIEPLHASIEGSYRFYHDSFEINSHTLELTWHQWLGKHVILEPMFRYYWQGEADFYAPNFPGITPPGGVYFSSDYRLSNLYSLDYGLQATIIVTERLSLNAGYHRYEMFGLDGKTADGMYPKANIFTVGLSIKW